MLVVNEYMGRDFGVMTPVTPTNPFAYASEVYHTAYALSTYSEIEQMRFEGPRSLTVNAKGNEIHATMSIDKAYVTGATEYPSHIFYMNDIEAKFVVSGASSGITSFSISGIYNTSMLSLNGTSLSINAAGNTVGKGIPIGEPFTVTLTSSELVSLGNRIDSIVVNYDSANSSYAATLDQLKVAAAASVGASIDVTLDVTSIMINGFELFEKDPTSKLIVRTPDATHESETRWVWGTAIRPNDISYSVTNLTVTTSAMDDGLVSYHMCGPRTIEIGELCNHIAVTARVDRSDVMSISGTSQSSSFRCGLSQIVYSVSNCPDLTSVRAVGTFIGGGESTSGGVWLSLYGPAPSDQVVLSIAQNDPFDITLTPEQLTTLGGPITRIDYYNMAYGRGYELTPTDLSPSVDLVGNALTSTTDFDIFINGASIFAVAPQSVCAVTSVPTANSDTYWDEGSYSGTNPGALFIGYHRVVPANEVFVIRHYWKGILNMVEYPGTIVIHVEFSWVYNGTRYTTEQTYGVVNQETWQSRYNSTPAVAYTRTVTVRFYVTTENPVNTGTYLMDKLTCEAPTSIAGAFNDGSFESGTFAGGSSGWSRTGFARIISSGGYDGSKYGRIESA